MSINSHANLPIYTSSISGGYLSNITPSIYNTSGSLNSMILENANMIEYIDFTFQVLGIEITYDKFKGMTKEEKNMFLRDIKINKIIC